jgi:GNAT superfamily N-acetyltransferase
MWTLLKDDPRFSCHGRAVAVAEYTPDNLPIQLALAKLQGVCAIEGVENAAARLRSSELQEHGLVTDAYVSWRGGPDCFDAARALLRDRALPRDLSVNRTGPETAPEDLQAMDALTQSCDVLLPMGAFLRGQRRPSVFLFAKDANGRVVGAAGAVAQFHPDHAKAGKVWWGMLSTDPSRRGEGIALILGAMALKAINEDFGYSTCFTGIREGNAPSETLCRKLALAPSDNTDLIAIYPPAFSGGQLTK